MKLYNFSRTIRFMLTLFFLHGSHRRNYCKNNYVFSKDGVVIAYTPMNISLRSLFLYRHIPLMFLQQKLFAQFHHYFSSTQKHCLRKAFVSELNFCLLTWHQISPLVTTFPCELQSEHSDMKYNIQALLPRMSEPELPLYWHLAALSLIHHLLLRSLMGF